MKIMLVTTNYAKNYASIICQNLTGRSEILVHRWGTRTRIYFGATLVSSVAQANSHYESEE